MINVLKGHCSLAGNTSDQLSWLLPKVLRHDQGILSDLLLPEGSENSSILLLEDLGEVLNLYKTLQIWSEQAISPKICRQVSRIGTILGHSLAQMHSQNTLQELASQPAITAITSQKLTDDAVWYLVMEPLPGYLAPFPKGESYFRRLVDDVKAPKYSYPPCVMHGDFNYGNIVLKASSHSDDEISPYVIDWEFSTSQGRGVNGDIPEFLSLLHCRLISARHEHPSLGNLLRLLCTQFCSAYRAKAHLNCTMEPDNWGTRLYRSTLLLSGRDIINFANYACGDDATFDEMVKVGLWYLEHAGDDMDEFLEFSNQEELAKEDESLVRSLFVF